MKTLHLLFMVFVFNIVNAMPISQIEARLLLATKSKNPFNKFTGAKMDSDCSAAKKNTAGVKGLCNAVTSMTEMAFGLGCSTYADMMKPPCIAAGMAVSLGNGGCDNVDSAFACTPQTVISNEILSQVEQISQKLGALNRLVQDNGRKIDSMHNAIMGELNHNKKIEWLKQPVVVLNQCLQYYKLVAADSYDGWMNTTENYYQRWLEIALDPVSDAFLSIKSHILNDYGPLIGELYSPESFFCRDSSLFDYLQNLIMETSVLHQMARRIVGQDDSYDIISRPLVMANFKGYYRCAKLVLLYADGTFVSSGTSHYIVKRRTFDASSIWHLVPAHSNINGLWLIKNQQTGQVIIGGNNGAYLLHHSEVRLLNDVQYNVGYQCNAYWRFVRNAYGSYRLESFMKNVTIPDYFYTNYPSSILNGSINVGPRSYLEESSTATLFINTNQGRFAISNNSSPSSRYNNLFGFLEESSTTDEMLRRTSSDSSSTLEHAWVRGVGNHFSLIMQFSDGKCEEMEWVPEDDGIDALGEHRAGTASLHPIVGDAQCKNVGSFLDITDDTKKLPIIFSNLKKLWTAKKPTDLVRWTNANQYQDRHINRRQIYSAFLEEARRFKEEQKYSCGSFINNVFGHASGRKFLDSSKIISMIKMAEIVGTQKYVLPAGTKGDGTIEYNGICQNLWRNK